MKLKYFLLSLIIVIPFFSFGQYGTVKGIKKILSTGTGSLGLFGVYYDLGSEGTSIGDLDGNGVIDIATRVVGEKTINNINYYYGYLVVVLMHSNGMVKSHKLIGSGAGISGISISDFFGSSIVNMGDLNNDGVNDIAVGDIYAGASNSQTGAVTFVYLNKDGSVKDFKQINRDVISSLPNNGYFGNSLTNLGDLDGDGYQDIAVSSSEKLNGKSGCVYILFLDSIQNIKKIRKIGVNSNGLSGNFSNDLALGSGVSNIGDFDKDGVTDIAFKTVYKKDSVTNLSGIMIVYLKSDGTVKSFERINHLSNGLHDLIEDDGFGYRIVRLNDLDGDQVNELAVGATNDTTYNVGRGGSVRILFMNADGTVKSVQKIDNLSGNFNQPIANRDFFGSIGPLGDFNNDSIPDLLVGASGNDEGGSSKGALYLLMLNGVPSVGINDVIANRIQVNLYPNPAKHQVQVSCLYPVTQITITDVTGKVIHQQKNNEPIQVQTWQAGMYYLQVNTTQGTAVQKLVKQ
jgi:hypothetical protein